MINGSNVELVSFEVLGKPEFQGKLFVNREISFRVLPSVALESPEDCRLMATAMVVKKFWDELYGDISDVLVEIMKASELKRTTYGEHRLQDALEALSTMHEKARALHARINGEGSPRHTADQKIAYLMPKVGMPGGGDGQSSDA